MSTDNLFLDAFASGQNRPSKPGRPIHEGYTNADQRGDFFTAAFSAPERKGLPNPSRRSWRLNTTKASRLSFSELMELDQLQKADIHYSELPSWIIETGVATPTQAEKQRQAKLEKDTDLNTVERAEIYSAYRAEISALAAMAEKETLRGSIFLDQYLEAAWAKYGESEVMDSLKSEYPQAAEYLVAHLEVKRAEAKAAESLLQTEQSQQDVAAEIKAAQEAIAAMEAEWIKPST